jgi:hypothetical protein
VHTFTARLYSPQSGTLCHCTRTAQQHRHSAISNHRHVQHNLLVGFDTQQSNLEKVFIKNKDYFLTQNTA